LVRISSPKLRLSMLLHGTLSEVPSGIEFPCQTGASIRAFGARLPFWPTSLERPGGSGLWLFCLGERGSDGLRGPLPRCLRSPLVPLRGLVSFLARCLQETSGNSGNLSNIWHFFSCKLGTGKASGTRELRPIWDPNILASHASHQDSPAELEAAGLGRAVVRARRKKDRGRTIAVGFAEPLVLVSRFHRFRMVLRHCRIFLAKGCKRQKTKDPCR